MHKLRDRWRKPKKDAAPIGLPSPANAHERTSTSMEAQAAPGATAEPETHTNTPAASENAANARASTGTTETSPTAFSTNASTALPAVLNDEPTPEPPPPASSTPGQETALPEPHSLWNRAYQKLRESDSSLVVEYEMLLSRELPDGGRGPAGSDVAEMDAFNTERRNVQLSAISERGLQRLDNKKTKYTIFGHEYILRDQVAQGTQFVLSMQSFISEAVKASPEASLTWAGVCVILPIFTNPSAAAEAQSSGFTYVTSRTRFYVGFEQLLWPSHVTLARELREELEDGVVNLYEQILMFQLKSVVYFFRGWVRRLGRNMVQMDGWKGLIESLKQTEAALSADFKRIGDSASRMELEKLSELADKQCDTMMSLLSVSEKHLQVSETSRDYLQNIMTGTQNISKLLEETKIANQEPLDLPTVAAARCDSADVMRQPECLPGTRIRVQSKIMSWVETRSTGCIFWLTGPAGTGKSTLVRTLLETFLSQKQLAAGYFFKRGHQGRNGTAELFPTLASQLAEMNLMYGKHLRQSLSGITGEALRTKALRRQFEILFAEPLKENQLQEPDEQPRVIIVDALDECDLQEDICEILLLFSELQAVQSLNLRILLTSRGARVIDDAFSTLSDNSIPYETLRLHEEFPDEAKEDISNYLRQRLTDIKKGSRISQGQWPEDSQMSLLLKLATSPSPLFIYASTLCRFLEDKGRGKTPRKQLDVWLSRSDRGISQLAAIYLPILEEAFRLRPDEKCDFTSGELLEGHTILSAVMLLASPLSTLALAHLLEVDVDVVDSWLQDLQAVLNISPDLNQPLELLHKSFSDFLLDDENPAAGNFHVDAKSSHSMLLSKCLYRMANNGLRRNICDLDEIGMLALEVDQACILDRVPSDLAYASLFWIEHFAESWSLADSSVNVNSFLQEHLLHWLELLSLLGKTLDGISAIRKLVTLSQENAELHSSASFFEEILRFVLHNKATIETAPLQIYTSALLFSPRRSLVRRLHEKELPEWIKLKQIVDEDWDPCLQTIDLGNSKIQCLAFSNSGRFFALGTSDRAIQLWDVINSTRFQIMDGDKTCAISLVFSADDQKLTSCSEKATVKVWDVKTGACMETIDRQQAWVSAAAISPDGQKLATCFYDKKFKLWDAKSDDFISLEGHKDEMLAITFSPDSQMLASASWDCTIKLWDIAGNCLKTLEGHEEEVDFVSFSADGKLLASASTDKTIKVWDMEGACLQTFREHKKIVSPVQFLRDNRRLVSGSSDLTLRIWDVSSGDCLQVLDTRGQGATVIAVSLDGQRILSGRALIGSTITVWDAAMEIHSTTMEPVAKSTEKHDSAVSCALLSDDRQLLITGSSDGKVKVWGSAKGNCLQTLSGHLERITCMALSANMNNLASGSHEGRIKLWDLPSGICTQTLAHPGALLSLSLSTCKRQRLVSGSEVFATIWDLETGECMQTIEHPDGGYLKSVQFSADNAKLIIGATEGPVTVWDIATGACVQKLGVQNGEVLCASLSMDSQVAVSSSSKALGAVDEDSIKVWDVLTGDCLHTFKTSRALQHISFYPKNEKLFKTSLGTLDMDRMLSESIRLPGPFWDKAIVGYGISFDTKWIVKDGKRILWLPVLYRSVRSAVDASTVVLGCQSGQVAILEFC